METILGDGSTGTEMQKLELGPLLLHDDVNHQPTNLLGTRKISSSPTMRDFQLCL